MKVTSRERMLIIAGIVVAVATLIFYAATSLIPDGEALAREVELKKRMLRSQRETLTYQESYRARVEQYKKQLEQEKTRFLPGDNANLAGAELQKVVRGFADNIGVEVSTSSILQEKKIEGILSKISVRVDITCTPEQLVQIMTSIQNHDKLLKIDDMQINSFRSSLSKRSDIRPSLTVSGFIAAQEEKAKPKTASKQSITNVS